MKAAYLGGDRGHQAAIYRPGSGWSGTEQVRRFGRQPQALRRDCRLHVSPLATAHRRRPGLRTKTLIVTSAVAVATLLAMVFSGGVQL